MKRRRPFSSESVPSLERDVFSLRSTIKGEATPEPSDAAPAGPGQALDKPLFREIAGEFSQSWKNNDKNEFLAFEGLLNLLEFCLSTRNYELFAAFVQSLGDDALTFVQASVTYILDSDVYRKTGYQDTLLEFLGLLQFRRGTSKPLLSMVLHSSAALKPVYLNASKKRAEERLKFFQTKTAVEEQQSNTNGQTRKWLRMNAHPIFNDFHLPQQCTMIVHDDDFPVYTVDCLRPKVEQVGYVIRSPKRENDQVRGNFLRATISGVKESITEQEWLSALQMNFRFALQFARQCRTEDIIWVQDLQFVFTGAMLQTLAPNLNTVMFVECPFLLDDTKCNAAYVGDIFEALLGFSKIAFQTKRDCEEFRRQVTKIAPAKCISEGKSGEHFRILGDVVGQHTCVTYMPIGVTYDEQRVRDVSTNSNRKVALVSGFDATRTLPIYLRALETYTGAEVTTFDLFFMQAVDPDGKSLVEKFSSEFVKPNIVVFSNPIEAIERLKTYDVIFHDSIDFKIDLIVKNAFVECTGQSLFLSEHTGLYQEIKDLGLQREPWEPMKGDLSAAFESISSDPTGWTDAAKSLLRNRTLESWFRQAAGFWSQTDLLYGRPVHSLVEFSETMQRVRTLRLRIATCILKFEKIPQHSIESLRNVARALEQGMSDTYARDFTDKMDKKMPMNVRDEVLTLRKDIRYLQMYKRQEPFSDFVKYLAEPGVSMPSPVNFEEEIDELAQFLTVLTSTGLKCFITDWDGTMKTYATSYNTCMQPAYSAIIIAAFSSRFTELSAVLTAGPLRNTGILDLTCVPDGYITCWGGSWGQEWLIYGRHQVNTEGLSAEGLESLGKLADNLDLKILNQDEFTQFRLVGSGFQRKVDRINLGIQTVMQGVPEQHSKAYVRNCLNRAKSVDPSGKYLTIHETDYDLEIIVKDKNNAKAFTKADGVDQCLKHMGVTMSDGNVLICGDTSSDLPMVERALALNPQRTFAIFVDAKEAVKARIRELLPPDRRFFASCPEVVHCAMAYCLMQPVALSGKE